MSTNNDSLIDEDGVVYEKGYDGQYHPKQGYFGVEKDTNWAGQPSVETDFLGNAKEEQNWLGTPMKSSDGKTLYRRGNNHASIRSSNSSSSSSSSGDFDLASVFVALLAPILIPIFFGTILLGAAFGIPFAVFLIIDNVLLNLSNIVLAIVLGTILSFLFCVVDVLLIKHFYSKLKNSWNGKFTIVYMLLLLIVPWLTGAKVLSSIKIENPISTATINPTSNPSLNTAITPTSPIISIAPTLFATQKPLSDITGTWDLNFTYKGYTNSSGVFKERSATENWSVNLLQSGNEVTGELLSVNSNYVDSCINARIEGLINKSDIKLLIYFTGSCCPNEIARIDAAIQNDNFIIGSYQPEKTPSGTCTLSTGDVTGSRK